MGKVANGKVHLQKTGLGKRDLEIVLSVIWSYTSGPELKKIQNSTDVVGKARKNV